MKIYFKKNPGIFRFLTLPPEISDETKLHPWKFCKIVLEPFKNLRPKTKTPGNSTSFFFWSPQENPLLFQLTPGNFACYFLKLLEIPYLQPPSPPPLFFFFWNSPIRKVWEKKLKQNTVNLFTYLLVVSYNLLDVLRHWFCICFKIYILMSNCLFLLVWINFGFEKCCHKQSYRGGGGGGLAFQAPEECFIQNRKLSMPVLWQHAVILSPETVCDNVKFFLELFIYSWSNSNCC